MGEQQKDKMLAGFVDDSVRRDLRAWRETHPAATFREIEDAVEEALAGLRVKLLQEIAGAGEQLAEAHCAACGTKLHSKGRQTRKLSGPGGRTIDLERSYAVCPTCGVGLFPPR